MSDPFVTTDLFQLLAVVTERHIFPHEVDFRDNRKELLHRYLTLTHDAYLYHIERLIHLVLQSNTVLLLVEYPPSLVELGVEG